MRYMVFVQMAPDPGEPPAELFTEMDAAMAEAVARGVIVDGGGLDAGPEGSTEIRLKDGVVTSTDGPYAEAKEVVGGYSIIEVRSHEEALSEARVVLDIHQRYWPGWEGAVTVRRIWGEPEGLR